MDRPIEYWIDPEDRIAEVNDAWEPFARENDAPHLTRSAVVGRSIWDFVSGPELRHLWRVLFTRTRARRRLRGIAYRCDGPAVRRFLEMELAAPDGDSVLCVSRLVRAEARERVALLDPHAPRARDHLVLCSWCKRVRLERRWLEVERAMRALRLFEREELPLLSHGLCEACSELIAD